MKLPSFFFLPKLVSNQLSKGDSIQPATAKGAQQKTIDGVVIPSAVSYGLTCSPINFLAAQEQSW